MPKLEKKRLPVLTAEELRQIVKACNVRDKAIVLFMADSGLRRAATINLNWGDVDVQSGLVRVKRGKGKKDRSAVIGATTRWVLLAYRRTIHNHEGNDPLFQTREGGRFASDGFIQIFNRIKKHTGIHVVRLDLNVVRQPMVERDSAWQWRVDRAEKALSKAEAAR